MKGFVFVIAAQVLSGQQVQASAAPVHAPMSVVDQVKRIISRGASNRLIDLFERYPNLRTTTVMDERGNTVMHLLAEESQNEMIAMLYARYAIPVSDKNKERPAYFFKRNDYGKLPKDVAREDSTRRLLELTEKKVYAWSVKEAVLRGDSLSVDALVKALSWTASLDYALRKYKGQPYSWILERALKDALLTSIEVNNIRIFAFLLESIGGDPDKHYGVWNGILENNAVAIVEKTLETWTSSSHYLDKAVMGGHASIARVLLEAGVWDESIYRKLEHIIVSTAAEQGEAAKGEPGSIEEMWKLLDEYRRHKFPEQQATQH